LNNKSFIDFIKDEDGATAIEYSVIGALISIVIVGTIPSIADSVTNLYNSLIEAIREG
jgi:pilus assembly protein Flp/PilA